MHCDVLLYQLEFCAMHSTYMDELRALQSAVHCPPEVDLTSGSTGDLQNSCEFSAAYQLATKWPIRWLSGWAAQMQVFANCYCAELLYGFLVTAPVSHLQLMVVKVICHHSLDDSAYQYSFAMSDCNTLRDL